MNVLRGLLLENMGLKLIALLLAIVVYLHVYTDRPGTLGMTFPIEITDLADSLAIMSQAPLAVTAELHGTGKQLIRLRLSEPHLQVSLAGVGPGRFQRSLTAQDLPMVSSIGLEVSRFEGPQMLEIQVERLGERELPVAARVEGTAAAGTHWAGEWLADPARVVVHGPRGVLAKLDSVRLAPVRIDGTRDTLRAVVSPAIVPPGCRFSPPAVLLRVPVRHGGA